MRYFMLCLAILFLGCGPNRKVEKGTTTIDKVETVPTNQIMAMPEKK
jgi:hypothetical protein